MLIWLTEWLRDDIGWLRLFQFITFRAVFAALTALFLSLFLGRHVIRWLNNLKFAQAIRNDGPQTHLAKKGTPTMGGALILLAIAASTLLWADWSNRFIWPMLLLLLGFGIVGWVDDYRKVVKRDPRGMRAAEKYFWQSFIGLVAAIYLAFALDSVSVSDGIYKWMSSGFNHALSPKADLLIPFFKTLSYPLGIWGFVVLSYLVIVGSSNAVNLTDGLDGLAILPSVMVAAALGVFAYLSGNAIYAKYLFIPHIVGSGELLVFAAAIFGAGLGFLWFNAHPAQVFMGDVGALALGAALGGMAVVVRQEVVLFIMGGVFVIETISVMLQVGYFKYTKKRFGIGRRIFLMAPLHHHFEQRGWRETQVVVRFWIISIVLVLLGLATLKLR